MNKTIAPAVVGCLLVALTASAQDDPNLIAPSEPLSPAEQIKHFHLPAGFEIELIAADPSIGQPTNIQFDAQGRLWINSTHEYPYPAKGGGKDQLKYMDDTDADGVPDAIHTFAEGLNIPIGVTRTEQGVVAYSIPSIDLFADDDGDGKADRREKLYAEFGYRDTHGMASSFRRWVDGWIYACHGFSNDSAVQGSDQATVRMNSGNTYRFRGDGSHIEQWTWGQVNPYGLAFDSWGNLYSSDCHTKPIYLLLRGAYYPSFGKPHDGLGFGPEMIEHLHGSTGIAGIVRYEADHFPEEYQGNVFIGNPVTGRVNRDRLDWHGSSPRAIEMPDFITCDDRWFRPVDVALAADGSLYIADFYNCIIGHYEVRLDHPRRDRQRGRIWRVVYRGDDDSARPARPRADLTKLATAGLIEHLGDRNLNVRIFATNELVERVGASALVPVREMLLATDNEFARSHALWVVERLGGLSEEEVDRLARDQSPLVRTHLVRALGSRQQLDNQHQTVLDRLTNDSNPFVVRAAAEVLSVHPHADNAPALVDVWRRTSAEDTHLIHMIRIALRNNLRDLGGAASIATSVTGAPEDVRARFLDVAMGIPNNDAAGYVLRSLEQSTDVGPREFEYFQHAVRYIDPSQLRNVLVAARTRTDGNDQAQADVLRAIFNSLQARGMGLAEEEVSWASDLARRRLKDGDPAVCRSGIEFARDLRLAPLIDALEPMARADSTRPELQYVALEAMSVLNSGRAVELLVAVLKDRSVPIDVRKPSAELLGKLKTPTGTAVLSELITFAPAELAVFVARGLSWSNDGAESLIRLTEEGKASPALLNDPVVAHELRFREAADRDARLAKLRQTIPTPDESLQQLMAERRRGFTPSAANAEKGRKVFEKNCASCHQVAGQGAKIGPQLDGVGVRGLDRLLEDTLDPDRNVDQAFRRTSVLRTDGSVLNGLVLRQDGQVLVIADAEGQEIRIPDAEIDEKQASTLSPMPTDIARTMAPGDFYDLMAYLLQQRPTTSPY